MLTQLQSWDELEGVALEELGLLLELLGTFEELLGTNEEEDGLYTKLLLETTPFEELEYTVSDEDEEL